MRMLTHFPPGLLLAAFDKLNARILFQYQSENKFEFVNE